MRSKKKEGADKTVRDIRQAIRRQYLTEVNIRYEVRDGGMANKCSTAIVGITIDVGIKPKVIHSDGFE